MVLFGIDAVAQSWPEAAIGGMGCTFHARLQAVADLGCIQVLALAERPLVEAAGAWGASASRGFHIDAAVRLPRPPGADPEIGRVVVKRRFCSVYLRASGTSHRGQEAAVLLF